MKSVKNEENTKPQTIEVATGDQTSECPPKPNASEKSPATVVSVVITTGNNRRRAA